MYSDINYAAKLRQVTELRPKATLTFFASNQEVTRPNSQSLFSRLTLLSKDLMAMDAIFLHMAESSLTIIRQRGMKNIPQVSWSSPYRKTGTGENTQNGIAVDANTTESGLLGPMGKQYLREGVKEIGNHFQGGFSSSLMFITRARTLGGLSSCDYFKIKISVCQLMSIIKVGTYSTPLMSIITWITRLS